MKTNFEGSVEPEVMGKVCEIIKENDVMIDGDELQALVTEVQRNTTSINSILGIKADTDDSAAILGEAPPKKRKPYKKRTKGTGVSKKLPNSRIFTPRHRGLIFTAYKKARKTSDRIPSKVVQSLEKTTGRSSQQVKTYGNKLRDLELV